MNEMLYQLPPSPVAFRLQSYGGTRHSLLALLAAQVASELERHIGKRTHLTPDYISSILPMEDRALEAYSSPNLPLFKRGFPTLAPFGLKTRLNRRLKLSREMNLFEFPPLVGESE